MKRYLVFALILGFIGYNVCTEASTTIMTKVVKTQEIL